MNDRSLAVSVPGLPEVVPADKTLVGHDAAGTLHWLQNTTSNGPGPLPKQGEVQKSVGKLLIPGPLE